MVTRKRKPIEGPEVSAKIPACRRGVINWDPPAIDGEDETTNKAHITWMQKEARKKQPKMKLTFSFRRKLINEGKTSLKEIKLKYPFLLECDEV